MEKNKISELIYEFYRKDIKKLLNSLTYENVHEKAKLVRKKFEKLEDSEKEPFVKLAEQILSQ